MSENIEIYKRDKATIADIVEEMVSLGYKITPRTVKYYVQLGLLPKPEKTGGYKEGVKLYFPSRQLVLDRLVEICEWKGRGYNLNEIEEEIRKKQIELLRSNRTEFLKSYLEINGDVFKRYFFEVDLANANDDGLITFSRYGSDYKRYLATKLDAIAFFANNLFDDNPEETFINGLIHIRKHNLYDTLYHLDGVPVYDESDVMWTCMWINMKITHGIDWNTLKLIQNQFRNDLENHFYWPKPDGIVFSNLQLEHKKKFFVYHKLCEYLESYITYIEQGFVYDNGGVLEFGDDKPYGSIDNFIDDYLSGKVGIFPRATPSFFCRDIGD